MALFSGFISSNSVLVNKNSCKYLDEELKTFNNITMWPTAMVRTKSKPATQAYKVAPTPEKAEQIQAPLINLEHQKA